MLWLTWSAVMPEEVGPPACAPVMVPEAFITATRFFPVGVTKVVGEILTYFFSFTCAHACLL